MKRKTLGVMALTAVCTLNSCFLGESGLKKSAQEKLNLDLSSAAILEEWDTHGGFHGDGNALIALSVSDGFEEQIKHKWNPYPLTDIAYTYYYEWGGMFDKPNSTEKAVPELDNGYWYFQSTGPQNWIFAAFDEQENILYYYVFNS